MKSLTILKVFVIATSLTATASLGADGSSGCGPGWYIFKKNSFVSSALRVTTNGWSSPLVTLGMTLGTSNCAKHSMVMNNKRGLHFVTHNTHNLIAETAMGHGENLGALAMTMGCDWRAQPVFNDVMKANFNLIYGAAESAPEAIYEHMLDAAAGDSMLAQSCSALNI